MLEFKKPKLVRKSDFINYFIRPRDQWFYSETQLADYIRSKTKGQLDIDETEDTNIESEYDPLEALRLAILNGETIDKRDPKIYEGSLIDQKSRDFIKLKYIRLDVYDFDEKYPGINDFNFLANETKKILIKDNFILFQPVFIYKNKAITRPDALIKNNGKYTIIEVKGTSRPKAKHFVDLVYQAHVINNVLSEFHANINDYLLCVVKYAKNTKGKIDFELTNRIPLLKGGKDWSEKVKSNYPGIQKYTDEAIEVRRQARLDSDSEVTIENLMQGDLKDWKNKKKKVYDDHVVELLDDEYFEKIIDELHTYMPANEPQLEPDYKHFKAWFDDYPLLKEIRKYYFNDNRYLSYQWSAGVVSLPKQNEAYETNQTPNETALRNYLISIDPSYARFFKDFYSTLYTPFTSGVYRTKETKELFSTLRENKVYFDFESINPATCVVDDTVPYTQIVTQVSIIKNNQESINIVNDPKNITIENFKQIIDAIYNGENSSYIVYNKGFECSRLKEMAALIDDSEYTKKVEIINNNIFDLCFFFMPKKDLVTIRELRGYYSIKSVLPIVKRDAPHLFKEAGAKDYHGLEGIHNGSEALNQTSRRFFGLVNDEEWQEIVEQLKDYCENDVRAMIAVEYYIKEIIS